MSPVAYKIGPVGTPRTERPGLLSINTSQRVRVNRRLSELRVPGVAAADKTG